MKFSILFIALLTVTNQALFAENITAHVKELYCAANIKCYIRLKDVTVSKANCDRGEVLFDPTTDLGKVYLSMVMSARASNLPITLNLHPTNCTTDGLKKRSLSGIIY